ILPWKPESASVRQRALFNRLKGMNTAAETTDPRLGEALIECGLTKAGFEKVFVLKEGVAGWSGENLPLVRGK
ncbi:hypothetical protein MJN54_29650, partial [Salmonella enterica subsp. enterica serovar Kentucky]|nr:hypothetical protein [Salmonella enterica subsp. enterica serovar Kentucky]